MLFFLTVLYLVPFIFGLDIDFHPDLSYNRSSYSELHEALKKLPYRGQICIAHSSHGFKSLAATNYEFCEKGVVIYGYIPSLSEMSEIERPLLIVGGSLDGISSITHFAVARHNHMSVSREFAAIKGAAHFSIIDSSTAALFRSKDLLPILSKASFDELFVDIVSDFVGTSKGGALARALADAAQLAEPIVEALELEGSAALGEPQCNSDYPTNPTCQYPIYPGKSLPPGPEPAPSPPLPSTCVCGCPWVMTVGSHMSADFASSLRPSTSLITSDAFHDVSDTHPFHLPNIFNECDADLSQPCALNLTTVTMPILKAGDLFSSDEDVFSAFELRTKFKSRQATWEKAGLGSGTEELDQGTNVCRDINQRAYDWALSHAEPSVREMFDAFGEPYVMVDDVEAPIGDHGPTWIDEELIYTRVTDEATGKSRIEIQSWSFVVANVKDGDVPWFVAVGMHYCKLLSPARAMEWIYTEGLRTKRGM